MDPFADFASFAKPVASPSPSLVPLKDRQEAMSTSTSASTSKVFDPFYKAPNANLAKAPNTAAIDGIFGQQQPQQQGMNDGG